MPGPQRLPFKLGIHANRKLGRFLTALGELERELRAPPLHAALLAGGSGIGTYAASSKMQIERRTAPRETEAQAVAGIQALVARLAVEPAATPVRGIPPGRDTPWMEAALCQAAAIESAVFRPAGGGAHVGVEWVDLESVVKLARILALTAADYCG